MRKILVAVDGSECVRCSRDAFEYCLEEVKKPEDDLTVLQVVRSFGYSGVVFEKAIEEEVKSAEEFTGKLKKIAEERGIDVDTKVINGPHVATSIIKFADENDYDLIVVGSRGRSGLETVTLGSVSEGVVKRAHCPVLVVR